MFAKAYSLLPKGRLSMAKINECCLNSVNYPLTCTTI